MTRGATAIAFVHQGRGWYLPYSMSQAASASPGCRIVLFGNHHSSEGVVTVPLDLYGDSDRAKKLRSSYVHMHNGDPVYELFCFLRWFHLLGYMEESGTAAALYLDSDVLLYSSVREILESHPVADSGCGLSVPDQREEDLEWHVSGHTSYWTIDALRAFCEFVLRSFSDERYLSMYRRKWEHVRRSGQRGGVSDMTALYLFWREHGDSVTNFAAASRGCVVEHNMNLALNHTENEYEMVAGRKRVEFVDGAPMLVRRNSGEKVRGHALHLQGGAKNFIPLYYRGQSFDGKRGLDSYAALRRIGQRGKRLVGR